MPTDTIWNRKPLLPNLFAPLPLPAIRPTGRLLDRITNESPATLEDSLLQAELVSGDPQYLQAQYDAVVRLMNTKSTLSGTSIRALLHYHAITGDRRAAVFMLQYAQRLHKMLIEGISVPPACAANASDLLRMLIWLYNVTGRPALLSLCRLVKAQSPDWMSTFFVFPQTKAVRDVPDASDDGYWRVHGPTIAASLRTPALQALFEGGAKNETASKVGWEKLMRYHGAAHGIFNADPLLAGANPSRTVHPDVIAEMVCTCELLLWAQGACWAGDLMEKIIHGPAAVAAGPQAANQLHAGTGAPPATAGRYAASLWMATSDNGLAVMGFAPCQLRWRIHDQPIRIRMQTDYPYGDTVSFEVITEETIRFPLRIRIPQWANEATLSINGMAPEALSSGTFACVDRPWQRGDTLLLTLPAVVHTHKRYHQSISIEKGPLLYTLAVENGTPWNMALAAPLSFETGWEQGIPVLYADAAPVQGWESRENIPEAPPIDPALNPEEIRRITLRPYAQTAARIAQFPVGSARQTPPKE